MIHNGSIGSHMASSKLRSTDLHPRFNGHPGPQKALRIFIRVEANSNREPLHDFDIVSRRVFRREQAEKSAGGAGHVFEVAIKVMIESVDVNANGFTGLQSPQLRLFEIGGDPDVVQGNENHQSLAGLYSMAEFHCLPPHNSAHGSVDLRIAEVEPCRADRSE